jgi:hypothetical protein
VVTGSRYEPNLAPEVEDQAVVLKQAEQNKRIRDRLYAPNEWPLHGARMAGDGGAAARPPKLCVALSGGGIRSAAFAVGVLRGLHSAPGANGRSIFDAVDIISATSGGAYAMTWYYVQKHRRVQDLFGKEGATKQLYERAPFYRKWLYVTSGAGNLLLSPLNFVVNGLFGWHMNTSWFGYSYDGAISRTFHEGELHSFGNLRDTIVSQRLPSFVITTTARLDEDMYHQDALFALTVFEFTPFKWGSDAFGYKDIDEDLRIDRVTAIAGSAPDSTQAFAGASQRVLGSALNFDVGRFVTNRFEKEKQSKVPEWAEYLAPIPLYLVLEGYKRDSNGRRIYLSDGGHQENLAAFPLVRRLCDNIIIIDGEEDEKYWFDSYFKFRDAIKRETGANVRLIPRPVPLANDPKVAQDVPKAVQDVEALETPARTPEERGKRSPFRDDVPVVTGTIRSFPLPDGAGGVKWKPINLAYVKLAVDPRPFKRWENKTPNERQEVYDEYGEVMSKFYLSTARTKGEASAGSFTCERSDWFVPCVFPQLSTFHQSFSPAQFQAYVELGASIVCHHLTYDGEKINVRLSLPSPEEAKRCFQGLSFQELR